MSEHVCPTPEECCRELSRVWQALGGTYNGQSASERVEALRAALAEAERQRDEVKGAMRAQDERERRAGERCGVSAIMAGCDWPDQAAERILTLEQEHADLLAFLQQWQEG